MIIDPNFVDVDFSKDPRYTRGDNATRPFRKAREIYEAAVPQIPESDWQKEAEKLEAEQAGLDWLVTRILDQSNEGSCVGNAATQQHQVIQAKQFGIDKVVQLSAMSMYQLIGSSANSGASIDDALDEGTGTGFIPLDNAENKATFGTIVMPATGWRAKRPTGWEPIAKRFRFDESMVVQSVGGMVSASLSGNPIVVGRSGHSICYLRVVYVNGKMYFLYANSWSLDWGQAAGRMTGGFGLDSASYVRSSAQWCYAVRTILNPYALAA